MLVVTMWRSLAHLIAPVITTTSIVLSSNKIQNGDILVLANPSSRRKRPLNACRHCRYVMLVSFLSCHLWLLIQSLFFCRQSAPGQSECETSLQNIDGWIHHLDQASLAAVGQNLSPQHDGSVTGFQEQVIASARQLLQQVEPIRRAAKGETGNLERYVCFNCFHICDCYGADVTCSLVE